MKRDISELLACHQDKIRSRNVLRVSAICSRIKTQRHATKLWNCIDDMQEPEPLWDVMLSAIPWAFRDARTPNSMRFTC